MTFLPAQMQLMGTHTHASCVYTYCLGVGAVGSKLYRHGVEHAHLPGHLLHAPHRALLVCVRKLDHQARRGPLQEGRQNVKKVGRDFPLLSSAASVRNHSSPGALNLEDGLLQCDASGAALEPGLGAPAGDAVHCLRRTFFYLSRIFRQSASLNVHDI